MKKIMFLIFQICLLSAIFLPTNFASAEDSKTYYAKVQSSGIKFCSTPAESSALFEIPTSYFVKVEYVVDDFFKVSYKDVEGYVKKDKVSLMDGTPTNPYVSSQFSLFTPFALYETPYSSSQVQANLTKNMSLDYYGIKGGEEYSDRNTTWYYCSAEIDGEKVFGYVFSQTQFNNPQESITVNQEVFEIVPESVLLPTENNFSGLSTGTKIMLIVAISVPSVLILYFLIKPSKIMQITKTKKNPKQERHKIHHGDYFEFDESQLS